MKKLSLIFVSVIAFLLCTLKLYAIEGYTTDYGIRVRSGAGVGYELIAELGTNTTLDVVSKDLENIGDSDCSSGWYKIIYDGVQRYICSLYVSLGSTPSSNTEINTDSYDARISETGVNVRSGAGSAYSASSILPGTNVSVIGNKVYGAGCADGWSYVKYNGNKTGYVCSTYIKSKSEITASDSSYEQILRNAGFPESYIPYLVYLHKLHPTWKFNALQTGLYWDNVISGESWKNYLPFSDSAYTMGATDEYGWYYAKDSVNAFYIDPRNFLTENFIFMFQTLAYNYGSGKGDHLNMNDEISKLYYSLITNMVAGTYLNTDEYKMLYMNAGYNYNISPVHLVSRSVQEGMTSEDYGSVSGRADAKYNEKSVFGFYNYYNIGSYVDSFTSDPVVRGLAFACGEACGFSNSYNRPWDTREKAITYGAKYLADNYVNDGQSTTYFQKFNTNPASSAPVYTYQYMTNVLAPTSEAENMYYAYKADNMLDVAYVFDIPVYLNMPASVSLPIDLSSINSLTNITVNGKTITGFDKDVLEYTYRVTKDVNSINLDATRADNKSNIRGIGTINLANDETKVEISVTSESGLTKVYKITIIKVEDTTSLNDIIGKLSVKVNNNIMYNISNGVTIRDIKSTINKISPNATVTVNDKDYRGVSDSETMKTGYMLTISTPSNEAKTYNVAVTADTNGDGKVDIIDLLRIQKHLLNELKITDAYYMASDTNQDGKVDIIDLLRIQKYLLNELKL